MKKHSLRWAFKTLLLSVSLSIIFSLFSQSLFPNLSSFFAVFVIVFFVAVSVIFDVVGVAFTTLKQEDLLKYKNVKGYFVANLLCENSEKVSSFGGDVVGDICGILSGAGGVSLVVNMNIQNANLYLLATCLTSSSIAGLTIFCKAIMKGYAIRNCEKIAIKIGGVFETSPFRNIVQKIRNNHGKNIEKRKKEQKTQKNAEKTQKKH